MGIFSSVFGKSKDEINKIDVVSEVVKPPRKISNKSQESTILFHLKEYGSITSWEAIQEYHITRLSAKIFTLRCLNHNIESVPCINSDSKRYVRYVLK